MENISPDLLQKYLDQTCSPEEKARVEHWFQQQDILPDDPHLRDMVQRAQLEQRMLSNIRETIAADDNETTDSSSSAWKWVTKIAASIILLCVIGVGVYTLYNGSSLLTEESQFNTVVNTSRSMLRQQLADGTTIWLHPRSRLEFPKKFEGATREVSLSGEAFFDVAKDASHPFIITTGKVTTKVLGTSFNIKAYDNDPSIEVSVLTGSVAVQVNESAAVPSTSRVLLTPNERVTYLKENNELHKEEKSRLPELVMWQATSVVFDNVPVRDVIATLAKKFNTRIQVQNNNLLNCLIRADFTHQNLPDILDLLSKSVDATYELKHDTILLKGEGCVVP